MTRYASRYYLVPRYNLLIPKCSHAETALISFLTEKADYITEDNISSYPLITEVQRKAICPFFAILPVKEETPILIIAPPPSAVALLIQEERLVNQIREI